MWCRTRIGKVRKPKEFFLYSAEVGPRNVNIPWPTRGMGDADYLYAFQQIVMPIAYDFNPDLVISQFLLVRCRFNAYFF